MIDPFTNRIPDLEGPYRDIREIVPSDLYNLKIFAVGLYVETGGTVSFVTTSGQSRQVVFGDNTTIHVGVRKVHQTGTTAEGIYALIADPRLRLTDGTSVYEDGVFEDGVFE